MGRRRDNIDKGNRAYILKQNNTFDNKCCTEMRAVILDGTDVEAEINDE